MEVGTLEVRITNHKELSHLTPEEVKVVKEELTLLNPKYIQAQKFSKYNTTSIPKYLTYYKTISRDVLSVPRGYVPSFSTGNEKVIDESLEVTVKYPKFKLELRETQKEAYRHYINDPDKGMIILPTGKGKSILGCYLAYRLKQRTLVIVHKDDLVSGWMADSKLCFGEDFKPGLIKAKNRKVGDQITIATIQTLNRISKEDLDILKNEFGLIIVDEMHHCPSSSFDLLHLFPSAYRVGLTATPERADGLTPLFNFHFGGIAYEYETTEDDKDILPVEVNITKLDLKYEPIVKYKGVKTPISHIPAKYRPRIVYHDLENRIILDPEYMNKVTSQVVTEFKKNRSIILFLNQKEHCRAYYDLLKDMGVPEDKMQLYYGDSNVSKEDMKKKAENKEVLITIATYSIATEGTNVKQWEVAFLVASVNNGKNVEQAIGRIRRTKEGKLNTVLVYDYALPNVYILGRHIHTRYDRYKKLHFSVKGYIPTQNFPIKGRALNFTRQG